MKTFIGFIIVLVVLGILGAIYWFYIRNKNSVLNSGTVTVTQTNIGTGTGDGTIGNIGPGVSVQVPFMAGDNVYLNPSEPDGLMGSTIYGIPVYSYPNSSTSNFLLGVTTHVWYDGKPLGTFVTKINDSWSKITTPGLQIYKYPTDYRHLTTNVVGEYFIHNSAIQKSPY